MLTQQGFGIKLFCWVRTPSYTMNICFLARPNCNFSFSWMEQKLHKSHIVKLLHAEQIKSYLFFRDREGRPFIANLCKLVPDHLIPLKIKCAQMPFFNFSDLQFWINTVRNIIIDAWIFIYPVMIYWYKSSENSITWSKGKVPRIWRFRLSISIWTDSNFSGEIIASWRSV